MLMSNILQTETTHAHTHTHTHAHAHTRMSQSASLQILAELRRRLWLADEAELSAESRELYTHIEKTLIAALSEHYEQEQKNIRGDRDNTNEPQAGHD
jgi:RNA polymerase-interacting CarD/CdnL/TRCF family regulator